MQLTASKVCALSLISSSKAQTLTLCGIVTERPAMPKALTPLMASVSSSSGVSKAVYTQSIFASLKAALSITGDKECFTGLPITPTKIVEPLILIPKLSQI